MLYSSSFDALKKSLVGVHKYIQVKFNFFSVRVIPILLDPLFCSVRYLDPYTRGCCFDYCVWSSFADTGSSAGSWMGKKSRSGIRIRDEHHGSYFRELRNNVLVKLKLLKFLEVDPGSGIFWPWIQDPGWKKCGSGIKKTSRIRNTGLLSAVF